MAAKVISRFGRTYAEFDPDGSGGGPPTWILAAGGAGTGGGSSSTPSGVFQPTAAGSQLFAGMAVYQSAPGQLDLAVALDAGTPGTAAEQYEVMGLAGTNAAVGQLVSVITDGQITLLDWTPVIGAPDLESGRRYYLSFTNQGQLVVTPPAVAGTTVVCVGQAIDQRTLDVEVNILVRN